MYLCNLDMQVVHSGINIPFRNERTDFNTSGKHRLVYSLKESGKEPKN
jgi:hypothetical protein